MGASAVACFGNMLGGAAFEPQAMGMSAIAIVLGMIGLVASLLHLGSPLGAWRVFLGLKTSWLSREVVLFGMWMPVLMLYAGMLWYPTAVEYLPAALQTVLPSGLVNGVGVLATVFGLLSVYCSIMVYVDTKREFWSLSKTCGAVFRNHLVRRNGELVIL